MSSKLKTFLQYLVILLVTAGLIWFSLRGLTVGEGENKIDFLLKTWTSANKVWLLIMAVLVMVSHVIRAERWRMLIEPVAPKPKLGDSFLSLMVGYIVNLVIPRGGEVSRCYNLYRLDKTPVEVSFGTVVVERIVDLVCLVSIIIIAFVVEYEKLMDFIATLPIGAGGSSKYKTLGILALIGLMFLLVIYFIFKKNKKLNEWAKRTWIGFRGGLLSIFKLRQKGLFVLYSIMIWFLYFLMSYSVLKAFPETEFLGLSAVLSLFAIGSIAMAAPLPGGTGSYHVLVPQGLVFLYAVPLPDAVAFTFIFHGWQTAIMIVGGAISLVITSIIVRKKSTPA